MPGSRAKRSLSSAQFVALHRSRFLTWNPTPIVALAASGDGSVVAAAREDGSIELWDVASWTLLQSVPYRKGCIPSSVQVLYDGQQWRVFSGGLDGILSEIDCHALKDVSPVDSYGGAVWAMATQPTREQHTEKDGGAPNIAVGCDDGVVRIFHPNPGVGSGLRYRSCLPKVEGRILAVAWHPTQEGVVVTGGSDGCIRAWDINTSRELIRITSGDGSGVSDVCCWSLLVLGDGTIVSGDSNGNVMMWDAKFGTLLQRLTPHIGDVLTLAAASDGNTLFSGGMDGQVVMLSRVVGVGGGSAEWVLRDTKRGHTHDVRAMTIVPRDQDSGGPVLISGGNDTQLLAYPVHKFHKEHPVRVSKVSQLPILQSTTPTSSSAAQPEPTYLLSAHHHTLQLWRITQQQQKQEGGGADWLHEGLMALPDHPPVLMLQFKKKGPRGIIAAALSPSAQYMAYCDADSCCCYSIAINHSNSGSSSTEDPPVTLNKLELPTSKLGPVCCLSFSGDSSQLIAVSTDGTVHCIDIKSAQLVHVFREVQRVASTHVPGVSSVSSAPPRASSSLRVAAVLVRCSDDGRWAAVSDRSSVHVMDVVNKTYVGRLPEVEGDTCVSALCFSPASESLMAATSDRQLMMYSLPDLKEAQWSISHAAHAQGRTAGMTGPVTHISFKPDQGPLSSCLVCTPSSLCHINMSVDPAAGAIKDGGRKRSRKAGKPDPFSNSPAGVNYRVLHLDNPCLYLSFIGSSSAVMVERPWSEVWKALPPPLYRHRFGT